MIYNNTEFYIQDNWKVNNRLTLDYGVRFTRQQPQHDQFQQMSNFFPEQWNAAGGAGALRAGLQQRRGHLLRQHRNAMDPRTGQILTALGAPTRRRRSARRSPAPAIRSTASARRATASRRHGYTWPTLVVRPALRRGLRPDRRVRAGPPRRRRPLLRPSGRQHGVLDSRATRRSRRRRDLRNGQLQTLGGAAARGRSRSSSSSSTTRRLRPRGSGRRACRWRCRGRRRSTSPTSATTATTASARSRAAATWST